jgi:hypothetical protein
MEVGTMKSRGFQLEILHLVVAAALLPLLMLTTWTACAQGLTGNVYFLTNQTSGNAVMVFHRDAAGSLVTWLIGRK